MRRWNVPVIVLVALLAASHATEAAASRLILRGGFDYSHPTRDWTGDLPITEGFGITEVQADGSSGPQVSLEYVFTRWIGGELSVGRGAQEFEASGPNFPRARLGESTQWPILIGANFHAIRNSRIDLYLGPVIGWVFWDDLRPGAALRQLVDIGDIKMHDDFAWGVNLGVDVLFGRSWALNFDVKDLDYSAKTDNGPIKAVLGDDANIKLAPITVTAGFARRW